MGSTKSHIPNPHPSLHASSCYNNMIRGLMQNILLSACPPLPILCFCESILNLSLKWGPIQNIDWEYKKQGIQKSNNCRYPLLSCSAAVTAPFFLYDCKMKKEEGSIWWHQQRFLKEGTRGDHVMRMAQEDHFSFPVLSVTMRFSSI